MASKLGPDSEKEAQNRRIFGQRSPIASKSSVDTGKGSKDLMELRDSEVNDGTAMCVTGSVPKSLQYNDCRFGKSGSVTGARKSTIFLQRGPGEIWCIDLTRRV